MGHRLPLSRGHFNNPHLQYPTCCWDRDNPGTQNPPEGLQGRQPWGDPAPGATDPLFAPLTAHSTRAGLLNRCVSGGGLEVTHARTHMHTHRPIHTCTHAHILTDTRTPVHTRIHTHMPVHTETPPCTHTRAPLQRWRRGWRRLARLPSTPGLSAPASARFSAGALPCPALLRGSLRPSRAHLGKPPWSPSRCPCPGEAGRGAGSRGGQAAALCPGAAAEGPGYVANRPIAFQSPRGSSPGPQAAGRGSAESTAARCQHQAARGRGLTLLLMQRTHSQGCWGTALHAHAAIPGKGTAWT